MYRMSNWRFALAAALTLIIGLATFSAAQAEGSLELNPSGDRTYFLSEPVSQIGIPNRTLINVYVNAGEYVLLGSSNYASLTATQDIGWTSPTGTDNGLCDVINGGTGHIGSRTLEAAGPRGTGNPSGWDPGDLANPSSSATDCVFEAAETGIYQVEFYSPNLAPTAAVTSDVSINSTPVDDPFPGNAGAAWDVTVRTDAEDETTTIEGRAYANWLSVTMGNWPATNQAILYILTVEGYLYRINMNNLDPFVFVFFSNSKGPRDINTGEALFRSVTGVGQGVDWNLHLPQNADNPATNDYTHKIFFNPPASDLPVNTDVPFAGGGTTWLVNDPVTPPVPTAFSFAGAEDDTPGQGAVGVGGTFTVTLDNPPVGGSLQVQLDINDDGDWDDPEDKTLFGDFTPGQNTVTVDWDGTDGTGAFVGAGTLSASTFRSRTNIAEVHFPFWDAESSPDGLIIERMTDPTATTVADATIYYDDSDPSLDPVGDQLAPNPRAALGGLDSTNGAHTWGTSTIDYSFAWGDGKLIDTWANLPSGTFVELDSDVTLVEADLAITKVADAAEATIGGPTGYTITVTNNGPDAADDATVTDTFPAALTNISWTCAASGGAACANASGSGNISEAIATLPAGGSVTFDVSATVDSSADPGQLDNTAIVTRPADVGDLTTGNNSDTATIEILVDPNLVVNGSFEDPLSAWTFNGQSQDDQRFATGQAFDGGHVLLFQNNNRFEYASQLITVSGSGGDAYQLSFQLGGQNVASGGRIGARIEFLNGGAGVNAQDCVSPLRDTFNWNLVTCNVATADGPYDAIRIYLGLNAINGGKVGFDGVEFVPVVP